MLKEITGEQSKRVIEWVDSKGGSTIPGTGLGVDVVWVIDEEPLVIKNVLSPYNKDKKLLCCSDKHAQELEQAGIVSFSKPSQTQE